MRKQLHLVLLLFLSVACKSDNPKPDKTDGVLTEQQAKEQIQGEWLHTTTTFVYYDKANKELFRHKYDWNSSLTITKDSVTSYRDYLPTPYTISDPYTITTANNKIIITIVGRSRGIYEIASIENGVMLWEQHDITTVYPPGGGVTYSADRAVAKTELKNKLYPKYYYFLNQHLFCSLLTQTALRNCVRSK